MAQRSLSAVLGGGKLVGSISELIVSLHEIGSVPLVQVTSGSGFPVLVQVTLTVCVVGYAAFIVVFSTGVVIIGGPAYTNRYDSEKEGKLIS